MLTTSTILWVLAAVSAVMALSAHVRARRLARRLDTLTQSYWELRYEHSRLKAQVARLDPATPPVEEPAASASPPVGFVPLSSLKKS